MNFPGANLEIKIVLPIPFRGSVLSASFRAFRVGRLSASSGMDRVAPGGNASLPAFSRSTPGQAMARVRSGA